MTYNLEEEEKYLASYLESVSDETKSQAISNRVYCCDASRSLYCPECYRILVPTGLWPGSISFFPFHSVDIILGIKERRTSSTGIQMMCVCRMFAEAAIDKKKLLEHDPRIDKVPFTINERNVSWWENIKLHDLNKNNTLPPFESDEEGTFVLFPEEGKSVPISSVAHKIKRLIILDIKWTRSANVKLFSDRHKLTKKNNSSEKHNPLASLNSLPFVHIEFPPKKSHYWRWHNRGEGMLSTLEAIYFAGREMCVALDKHNNREDLLSILWLFALQRSIIQNRCKEEGRRAAYLEEEKAHARALRNPMKRKRLKNVES